MAQAQLARAQGRGSNQVFRTLTTRERNGFVRRDPVSGASEPILRLHELGHAHSIREQLRRAARLVQELTGVVRESCRSSVVNHHQRLVFHQEQSPSQEER